MAKRSVWGAEQLCARCDSASAIVQRMDMGAPAIERLVRMQDWEIGRHCDRIRQVRIF